ncbi:hypothetical protein Droror1_Dr00018928 [Drosera rotundifolia]
MSTRMERLQARADGIANVTDISLGKQQNLLDGQSKALDGLQSMTKFQSQALEESRITLKKFLDFADGEHKKLLTQQDQLLQAHDQLAENSKSILAAQEAFESKQSNVFAALDKLFALHNAMLAESRFLKAVFIYSALVFFLYMFTSAKETYCARFRLYIGFERMARVYVGNLDPRVSERDLEDEFRVFGVLRRAILQAQKFFMETDLTDARNMGFQFAGKAVYTAVWVAAAAALFMELLGFSTQKWLTVGGLGTVLLTLAGREIQTKIEGYDVSGTVEHVGWWSPTIIRGEDREAVHIPNHKFTVNVVRNLSQKSHWRIKTHLAISHLDVNKINNIVADMPKVLSKNPQVEQQRLQRRVFLENICS